MQISLFFIFILGAPLYFAFALVFPEKHNAFLAMLYDPHTRVACILMIVLGYVLYLMRKKRTKHNYSYFNDLEIMEARTQNINYHYKIKHRGEEDKQEFLEYIILYIDGYHGYDFSLKFETEFEKFLKSWRLIHECQSGDVKFDDMIYIVSDDQDVCNYLTRNQELRDKLFELFWEHKQNGYIIQSLQYFDGRMVLTCKVEIETKSAKAFLDKSAVQLTHLIPYLPPKEKESQRLYREKTAFYLRVIHIVLGAFLINGVLKFFLDSISTFTLPRLVNRYELLLPAIELTVVLFLVYSIFALLIFYKSTRLAKALWHGVTLGALGFFLTSLTAIKEVNIYLDQSTPIPKLSQVVSKYKRTGRSTSYHITFQGYDEMRVNAGFYYQYHLHSKVVVFEKKGYLGMPWIVRISELSPESSLKNQRKNGKKE